MMFNLPRRRTAGLGMLVIVGMLNGCVSFPWGWLHESPPILEDELTGNSTKAEQNRGEMTKDGWRVGREGQLIYNLPAMSQGVIEFNVHGLNRTAPDTTFLTMIETPPSNYVDPYFIHNPYKVQLSLKNFQKAPRAPFLFHWTVKNFEPSVSQEDRFVPEVPENGYQQTVQSDYFPIFLGQSYHIKIHWFNGVAQLIVDGQVLAEHHYRPLVYDPSELQLILGRPSDQEQFSLPELTFSDLRVSFAKY